MTWVLLLASAAIACVAAAGILRPFRGGGTVALERLRDPLDDERSHLLRAIRELDAERAAGSISEDDHAALRAETERRAVAVLRALEARDASGDLAVGLRDLRPAPTPAPPAGRHANGSNGSGSFDSAGSSGSAAGGTFARVRRGPVAALVVGVALAALLVPLLIGAVRNRSAGGAISGDSNLSAPTPATDPALASLERRVRNNPNDESARLDLASAYVARNLTGLAALQFSEVLRLDPNSVPASTGLAMILLERGRPGDALYLLNRALRLQPNDPEALFDRGVVLLRGLHRPQPAAAALRAYLAAAPSGVHRREAERLLAGIAASPSPSSPPPATAAPGTP